VWLTRASAGKGALFLGNFGFSKAIAFFGPLAMAIRLDAATYGAIEIALACGLFLSLGLSLGLPSAFPQMTLRRRPVAIIDIIALLMAGNIGLLLAGALFALIIGAPDLVALSLAVTALSVVQGGAGVVAQTLSRRNAAAWLSSFSIIVVSCAALGLNALGLGGQRALALALCGVGVILLGVSGFQAWQHRQPEFRLRLSETWTQARPLLLGALVSVWIGNSSRVLLGLYFPLEMVALYSFGFRIAAVALVLHQVLTMAVFGRLYTLKARAFDRLGSVYVGVLGVALFVVGLVFPFVLPLLAPKAISPQLMAMAVTIFPVIALQVFAWIAGASLELRVNRVRRAGQAAVASAVVAVVTIGILWLLARNGALNIHAATGVLAGQMLAIVGVQLSILRRRGIFLPRILLSLLLGVSALSLVIFFQTL
jgi:O-antigen/teichoic acid export membrane protein